MPCLSRGIASRYWNYGFPSKHSWRALSVTDVISLFNGSNNGNNQYSSTQVRSLIPSGLHWHHAGQIRSFSSRYTRAGSRGFKLDALPFSISPEGALDKFNAWAVDDQGLGYLLSWNSVRIGAAYVPVWSFDVNIRFVLTDKNGKKRYDWKPYPFSEIYTNQQTVIHLPGLGAYAGHNYRRSLVQPLVNTTLVFMGDQTVPFEKFMLRDMKLAATGEPIQVTPDPWNTTQAQAFAIAIEDLENISESTEGTVNVQTEIVKSRRVYLPLFLIEYQVAGVEYQAFTSGADAAAGVSGVNHQVFQRFAIKDVNQKTQTFLSDSWKYAQTAANVGYRTLGPRNLIAVIYIVIARLGGFISRILMKIPFVALIGGVFVGFRKLIQPWMEHRRSSAEWERQREHEAQMHDEPQKKFGDDFVDNGAAQRYFYQNKDRILRYLGGHEHHERGDYDWYKDWEEWARRQWEQQQQQTYQRSYGQQQQRQQTYNQRTQQKTKPDYDWDFDPNDPYSVLGVRRGATKKEVAAAFRREMLKHHPDTNAGASEAQKRRAVERSKHITEAYRKIKADMK